MELSLASPPEEDRLLLATLPPSRPQRRLAIGVAAALVAALLATAPYATLSLHDTAALLPAYAAAALVNELITAALLLAMFSVQRSRGLLVLAAAYLSSGLLVIPWGLTFPGVFSTSGLLDAGLQSTATIAAIRRVGFPLLVLIYALLRNPCATRQRPQSPASRTIVATVVTVVLCVVGITLLSVAGDPLLPAWMTDERRVAAAWQIVPPLAIVLCLAAAAVMAWPQVRSVLDLWLLVVLLSALIEIALLAYLSDSRFSLGWWAGRIYGLASSSVVLLVLLSETVTLYVRLARSLMAERQSREDRLSSLEILAASIAHEVNQPLGSMVTNADAALRWLDRPQPEIDEARQALRRIAGDGHRAGKVIDSVRTMFKKDPGMRTRLDLNAIVDGALARAENGAATARVQVQRDLDATLPPVTGDPLRLEQVVANLLCNAIEALSSVKHRPRLLRVSTRRSGQGMVMVEVEDSGPGLDRQVRPRLFEPFFTTKTHGLGMGLLFCRSVIERHGGRLWADDRAAGGAIFKFTLPAEEEDGESTG